MSCTRFEKKTEPRVIKTDAPERKSPKSNLGELPDYAAKNIDLEEDMLQNTNP
jgi:hypothetical protein